MKTIDLNLETCAPATVCGGWIYAYGLYQPRWQIGCHLNSDWSQAVIMAKRKSGAAIEGFGRIIARHLETVLLDDMEYVITHVPAGEDRETYLFPEFGRCATETLADAIYGHLKQRDNILPATVLAQIRSKKRKQHQCTSDMERAENVKGIYAVTQSGLIWGKCVILVDDVLTSGATMRECADVLRSAGAKNVMGIALARTERIAGSRFITTDDVWPGGDAA
jgi:phosphoribosylpyrophosphate synthetase